MLSNNGLTRIAAGVVVGIRPCISPGPSCFRAAGDAVDLNYGS